MHFVSILTVCKMCPIPKVVMLQHTDKQMADLAVEKVPHKDMIEVKRIGDLVGVKALDILIQSAKSKMKGAVAGVFFS